MSTSISCGEPTVADSERSPPATHRSRRRRGREPADPTEALLVGRGQEREDEEVRREAGKEHVAEIPVAREGRKRERRAAAAARRIVQRARDLERERRDRRDTSDRERHDRRDERAADDEREQLTGVCGRETPQRQDRRAKEEARADHGGRARRAREASTMTRIR